MDVLLIRNISLRGGGSAILFAAAAGPLLVVVAPVNLGLVLRYSNHGFDFTDESFYLYNIADPSAYETLGITTRFGFFYHPLYAMLGGDIGALRAVVTTATVILGFFLVYLLLDRYWRDPSTSSYRLLIPAAALASGFLLTANHWVLTPNYNTLVLQGLMVVLIGLLTIRRPSAGSATIGAALIGLGGWMVFIGKPSSAAGLAVVTVLYGLLAGRSHWRPLLIAAAVALGLMLAMSLAIDGSPAALVDHLRRGVALQQGLQSGHSLSAMLRINRMHLSGPDYAYLAILAGFVLLVGRGLVSGKPMLHLPALLACVAAVAAAIYIVWSHVFFGPPDGTILLLATLVATVIVAAFSGRSFFSEAPHNRFLMGTLLLVMPYVYVLGTNNDYWWQSWPVSLFWVLGGLVLTASLSRVPQGDRVLLPVALVVQLFTLNALLAAFQSPYRQPPGVDDYAAVFDLRGSSRMVLADSFRDYLAEAVNTAKAAGFRPGMAAIDLTGQSPGILYAIGARSLGGAWVIGGYPGSDRLAEATLGSVDCHAIAGAWLLVEPGGPRSLSIDLVLQSIGMALTDYASVGSFQTATYAGGYKRPRTQFLLRPARGSEQVESNCRRARQSTNEDQTSNTRAS